MTSALLTARRPLPGSSDRMVHDFSTCIGCGICGEACPKGALVVETDTDRVQTDHRKKPCFDPAKCVHCGRCAAVCPVGCIKQPEFDAWLATAAASKATHAVYYCSKLNQTVPAGTVIPQPFPVVSTPSPTPEGEMSFSTPLAHQRFEPGEVLSNKRFVPDIFNIPVPAGVAITGVRCTGRIGGHRLMQMAAAGMQNVLIFACPPHDCEYGAGDTCLAELQVGGLKAMLEEYGMGDLRVEIITKNPATPERVLDMVTSFQEGRHVGM